MTAPRTKAGRALLAREDYNERAFPLITAGAIRAIEDEASVMPPPSAPLWENPMLPFTEEEEARFRALLRSGPPPHVTDGQAWRLLATLDAARLSAAEMLECAICGDYSVKGVEVHESCLEHLQPTTDLP